MKKVLILGAGRSSSSLIRYLLSESEQNQWKLIVADQDQDIASEKTQGHPNSEVVPFDIHDEDQRRKVIENSDLVISMLPARFHEIVAKECLTSGNNLLTASYTSPEMKVMEDDIAGKGLLFLNECGLDPGIDHMTGMKAINNICDTGATLTGFETFTGGLLAPNNEEDNPWKYKFTWNPRNVVIAGQGGVKFIQEGRFKYIPYHRLFRRTETLFIPGYGHFEGYANRDSLKYLDVYGLHEIRTMYRGTLRKPGFCKAWDIFVQLGATDDSYEMEGVPEMTHRQFINSFLSYNPGDSVELKLAHYMQLDLESEEMYKMKWLGMFEEELVGLDKGTPAQVLEQILKKKWTLDPEEKDMIVMFHKFNYLKDGEPREMHAHMVAVGEDSDHTAMSKTVGLPLGIAAKLVLTGQLGLKGLHIPILPEIYNPIISELESYGIEFHEKEVDLS